jgi:phage terminase large subunit-like protein
MRRACSGHIKFRHCDWSQLPELVRIVVAVDPAVTDTDQSDSHGIQADALGVDDVIYRLFSWEARSSPEAALKRAIYKAIELKATTVIVETDQGGDLWRGTFYRIYQEVLEELKAAWEVEHAEEIAAAPAKKRVEWPGLTPGIAFDDAKAGAIGSKAHRASLMLVDYEHGQVVHVLGTHDALERALKRFLRRKPFDLVDSGFWSWFKLRHGPRPRARNPAA